MVLSSKNWLSQISFEISFLLCKWVSILLVTFCPSICQAQSVGNYINNGSFEEMYDCNLPNPIVKAKSWMGIDSLDSPPFLFSSCNGFSNSPLNGNTYQWPKNGNNYAGTVFYCSSTTCTQNNNRSYLKNRLKTNLSPGKAYCVKFYLNVTNNSTFGVDSYGAYFGDNSLDTITKGKVQITYLNPQIQSISMLSDTLNWVAITGTFTANGSEKFLVIGNFKSDAATNKLLINSTNLPAAFCDVCIDDVSCIEIGLPAFAGRDTTVLPGSNVFIGREPDFALDSGCIWYKLPNMSTPIATISGLWVNPTTTSTYVVKQTLDCSPEKWDTVVVKVDPTVGLAKDQLSDFNFEIFPNPTADRINIIGTDESNELDIIIKDVSSKVLFTKSLRLINYRTELELNLANGIYFVTLITKNNGTIVKKLVISK